MFVVRVLTAIARPAIAGGAIAATATGAYFTVDHFYGDPPTPFQLVQERGQQLIVNEFGEHADEIVALDPDDIEGSRTVIATIDHAPGWGTFATLSPDGQAIAYTAIPRDEPEPSAASPSHAGVVHVDGRVKVLATDVDLLIAPVWTPDGSAIVVRKNVPEEEAAGTFELLLLDVASGERTTLTTWGTAALFPIDFSPDGSTLYFATLNTDGTQLYAIGADGSDERHVAHLSDDIARDWKLSPDGTTLAYSVAELGERPGMVTKTLDLATGEIREPVASAGVTDEFNPTWNADSGLTVSVLKEEGGGDAVEVSGFRTNQISSNDDSMDLPLDWSPDGTKLVVRAVEGKTPFEAGASYVEVVGRDGSRDRVSDSSDVTIVGWLE
jgi:Tol biopolymer transport system component